MLNLCVERFAPHLSQAPGRRSASALASRSTRAAVGIHAGKPQGGQGRAELTQVLFGMPVLIWLEQQDLASVSELDAVREVVQM